MPYVRFGCLMRADLDLDLLPAWIEHYRALRLDSYDVFLHLVPAMTFRGAPVSNEGLDKGNEAETARAADMLRAAGFGVHFVGGAFNTGDLRQHTLGPWSNAQDPDDRIVTCDSDEFFEPEANFREKCLAYDFIRGNLVDRWADALIDAPAGASRLDDLLAAYPREGNIHAEIQKRIRDLVGPANFRQGDFPSLLSTKILCAKARHPVAYGGSHYITPPELFEDLPHLEGRRVFHFSWRSNVIRRMSGRFYFRSGYLYLVRQFFNPNGPDAPLPQEQAAELDAVLDRETREDAEKGFVRVR